MKKLLLTTAFAALFAAPLLAQTNPGNPTPHDSTGGAKGTEDIRPGSVGPGSEKNSEVSPTSPSVPTHSQPPPEIPAGASGSSAGSSGMSDPATPAPPPNESGSN
jgi:hypothetical protein